MTYSEFIVGGLLFIAVLILVAIGSRYSGRALSLEHLKKKHFATVGYNEHGVAIRLRDIARKIGDEYQRRDELFAAMGQSNARHPHSIFTDLNILRAENHQEIERLWRERHEAEATAKLTMGLGELVDKIHDEGIPGPERVETPQTGAATT